MSGRPAVFLDRDGTLVHARHYPSRPEDLVLFAGIGAELRALQATGFALVVITNQSGIARGYFTEGDLGRMHDHLRAELAAEGVLLDGVYFCPHHPDGSVASLARRCDCRKPEPGMLRRAAGDLGLDLERSWFLGDILDDVEAGHRAGCRSVLVDLGTEGVPTSSERTPDYVGRDTVQALRIVREVEGLAEGGELDYRPAGWGPMDGRSTTSRTLARVEG
ncbi:MAG: HAD family hydrolase [Chloroflexota bacterium]|nr:HAD family hydrolase [Chloroflexota bacterium]